MDKPSRPVRNRKRSRKAWPPEDIHRPVKRLFTPEIKRMLKDWLVRRRENPYPNREEKRLLASETGLTYTQICNWFANWRRKLKNSGNDPIRKTWGNLIKNYNTNARGNVEQFSICSNDSIWGENGEDSRDSRSPSGGDHPRHPSHYQTHQHHHHHPPPQQRHHLRLQHKPACAKYSPKSGASSFGKMYAPYDANCGGETNNNNADCRNYADYMRLPDYGRLEDCPSNEDVREEYCFDHCYTPRNYETVFGIPEETRCYKVTQYEGKFGPEGDGTLEPLILAAAPTHYGRTFAKEVPNGGTLYITPTTTLSPATAPTINGGRSRSSKYKSSIMEKYLRDLGELEPTDGPASTVMPVLMAAIPFQQKHCTHAIGHELQLQMQPMGCDGAVLRGPPSLSKWLESAAKFTPSKNNYIDWENSGKQSSTKKRCDSSGTLYGGHRDYTPPLYGEPVVSTITVGHQKEEIDAAEALTRLANNFRTKFST